MFAWPFEARQVDDFDVEILEDPWFNAPGVFNLNVKEKSVKRIKDFKKLEVPYDGKLKIEW